MVILHITGMQKDLLVPIFWSMIVGSLCVFVYFLACRKLIQGWVVYAVMIAFSMAPSIIYVLAYFLLLSGTATYITGPPSYVYFFIIILCGFTFNARLCGFIGFFCGAQYFLLYLLSREHLMLLSGPDALMLQDLREIPFYFFKALIMFFGGITVAILDTYAAGMVGKILKQEKETSMLNRLFGQFVSSAVKDKIVRSRTGIQGERQKVAILFSDLVSFSTFSEGRTPEEIVLQLNEYFDQMVGAINTREGTIDKFIGDAIMAIFGGVIPLQNPTQAAFDAALLMRENLAKINTKWKAEGRAEFANRIGIHFGEVLLGPIGSRDRKDFTVIGDNVNVAARLEALCKVQKVDIIISRDVFDCLNIESQAQCRQLGKVQVKGRVEAVEVYGLI